MVYGLVSGLVVKLVGVWPGRGVDSSLGSGHTCRGPSYHLLISRAVAPTVRLCNRPPSSVVRGQVRPDPAANVASITSADGTIKRVRHRVLVLVLPFRSHLPLPLAQLIYW